MKKFALNAVAAAALGCASSIAFAAINLDTGVNSGVSTFASELNYSSTAPGVAITSTSALTINTKLGFGVSASQNRYIRVNISGAKFAVAVSTAPGSVNLPSVTPVVAATTFNNVVLVAGGAINDSYAIYQITANAANGQSSTDQVTLTLPSLFVTSANTTVSTTFTLYETATAAVADAPNTNLYLATGSLLKFGPALSWVLTPANNTAAVTTSFKKFVPSAPVVGPVALGKFAYGVAAVAKADGTAIALADLVTAATSVGIAGNFSAVAANGLTLDNNDSCGTVNATLTLDAGKANTSYTVGTTAKTANLCYTVTGNTAVPAQSITAGLTVVAATGSTAATVLPATIGTIDHDGTTLLTPYVNVNPAYVNRFVFTNSSGASATWTATVTTEANVTCTGGTLSGTMAVGTTLIDATTLCPTFSGAPRFSVVFNIAAPRQYVEGIYTSADKNSNAAAAMYRLVGPVTLVGTN